MRTHIKLEQDIVPRLCCPICRSDLEITSCFKCINPECQALFPVVNGIPILINEFSSLFQIKDFLKGLEPHSRTFHDEIKKCALNLIPSISLNIKAYDNYLYLSKLLLQKSDNPTVFVIGGSELGQGMEAILSFPSIQLVESDIAFGSRTDLICDAHDIPFIADTFDAVIIQAVLEYSIDPYRCVEEICRVLKTDGYVYSEVPFMQQVHGVEAEFMRFTHLGHRRLFRKFDEISSGSTGGPSMALAWAFRYFLLSSVSSKFSRKAVYLFTAFSTWWLKYLDYYLIDKGSAVDAASGFYFLGRKTNRILSNRELIDLYRGRPPS